jgi:hypothetical protein
VTRSVRQRRTATKLKLRSHTFRPSTIFLLIVFVATALWYLKPSAEDRRSEIKLIGTWEVPLTEARSATTETRLVQHSEHEIRCQVSRPAPVSRHLTTVKKILEIHFAITMLTPADVAFHFLLLTGFGGAGCFSDRCSGASGRT